MEGEKLAKTPPPPRPSRPPSQRSFSLTPVELLHTSTSTPTPSPSRSPHTPPKPIRNPSSTTLSRHTSTPASSMYPTFDARTPPPTPPRPTQLYRTSSPIPRNTSTISRTSDVKIVTDSIDRVSLRPTLSTSASKLSGSDKCQLHAVDARSDLQQLLESDDVPKPQVALQYVTREGGVEMRILQHGDKHLKSIYMQIDTHVHSLKMYKKPGDIKVRYIALESIHEIRIAEFGRFWRKLKDPMHYDLGFLIIYGERYEEFGIVANTQAQRNKWIVALTALLKDEQYHDGSTNNELWIRRQWLERSKPMSKSKIGARTFAASDAVSFASSLSYKLSIAEAQGLIAEVESGTKLTSCASLGQFLEKLHPRVSERQIFDSRCDSHDLSNIGSPVKRWSRQAFKQWIEMDQMQFPDEDKIDNIFNLFGDSSKNYMTFEGFLRFLHSSLNDVGSREFREVTSDMTRPLSEYFISSSHNTYLLGDQLRSNSSVEAYIRVLRSGCRCVELDCWDGADGLPIIYHGRTLTSKITFEEVVKVIRNYAFEASPYPLTLSIENHCSVQQQGYMANYLKKYLGNMLDVPTVEDREEDFLPSPEELQYKILIKNKKNAIARPNLDNSDSMTQPSQTSPDMDDEDKEYRRKMQKHLQNVDIEGISLDDLENGLSAGEKDTALGDYEFKVAVELSDLVEYLQPTPMKSLKASNRDSKYYEISSLAEGKMQRYAKREPVDLVRYNITRLSRIYPGGFRVDSSNYNPMTAWNCGCQMVALNFQTLDRAMHLHKALFKANGGCGYILKPSYLRDLSREFDPNLSDVLAVSDVYPELSEMVLTITVFSAEFLPRMSAMEGMFNTLRKPLSKQINVDGNPFYKILIVGTPADSKEYKSDVRTSYLAPLWNHTEKFNISAKMLCFLRFELHYTGVGLIGSYTINLDAMRQGYRYIYLENSTGTAISPATLFIHTTLETKVSHDINMQLENERVSIASAGPPQHPHIQPYSPNVEDQHCPQELTYQQNIAMNNTNMSHLSQYQPHVHTRISHDSSVSESHSSLNYTYRQQCSSTNIYAQAQQSHMITPTQPSSYEQHGSQLDLGSQSANHPFSPQTHQTNTYVAAYTPGHSPAAAVVPPPSYTPSSTHSGQQSYPPQEGISQYQYPHQYPPPPQNLTQVQSAQIHTVACPYCTVHLEAVQGTTMTCSVCLGVFRG
eukprot:CFRG0553T1